MIVVRSGIGKVLASITTSLLIQQYGVNMVINTGSAGGIGEGLQVGDIVISDKVATLMQMQQDLATNQVNYQVCLYIMKQAHICAVKWLSSKSNGFECKRRIDRYRRYICQFSR